jgi:arabinose operon protein AraL
MNDSTPSDAAKTTPRKKERTGVRQGETIGYLLDLDGTVYRGEHLVGGADSAVAELRRRGRRIAFVSNKPLHSRQDYAQKLTRLGVPAGKDDVVSSSYVVATYLADRAPEARVYAIGEPPLLAELEAAGLSLCEDPNRIDYVIAAFDRTFNYEKLNIAFQAIRRGAHFVATNPDRTCPIDGGEIPDAAGVIAALEATTGRKPEEIVGKPSPRTVRVAIGRLGILPERCAMVGDRLETDIAMAKDNGMTAVLTLTGVTSRSVLDASPLQPDFVIDSIAELPDVDRELERCMLDRAGRPTP